MNKSNHYYSPVFYAKRLENCATPLGSSKDILITNISHTNSLCHFELIRKEEKKSYTEWVFVSQQVDDFECVLHNTNSHQFFTIVTTFHHQ